MDADGRKGSLWESVVGVCGTLCVLGLMVAYAHAPQSVSVQSSMGTLSEPPVLNGLAPMAAGLPGPIESPEVIELGRGLYGGFCASCHGFPGMRSNGFFLGSDLFDGVSVLVRSEADVQRIIEQGLIQQGMTPWKGILSDSQIQAVARYLIVTGGVVGSDG
jgi:mono/diheme cytochrome c family protein